MKEFESRISNPKIEALNRETDLTPMAELYAQVFAGPPWNEFTMCTGCKKFSGLSTNPGDGCSSCGKMLVLAYPVEKTKNNIAKDANRDDAVGFIMRINSELAGFVYGYSYNSPDDFVNEKYKTSYMKNGIKELLANIGITNKFFYFSEIGVREDQRGKGFSNLLSGLLLKEAREKDLRVIMRTNWQSPMTVVANNFGMIQIMGPQAEADRNSRKITKTDQVVNNLLDSEIGDRVLFLLR